MFLLLVGFGLSVSGGITIIAYLNLIVAGHGLVNFIFFIFKRPETYLFLIGLLIMWLSIYFPASKDHDEYRK